MIDQRSACNDEPLAHQKKEWTTFREVPWQHWVGHGFSSSSRWARSCAIASGRNGRRTRAHAPCHQQGKRQKTRDTCTPVCVTCRGVKRHPPRASVRLLGRSARTSLFRSLLWTWDMLKSGSTLSEESLVDVRLVRAVTALTLSGIFSFIFSFSFLVVDVVAVILARPG